jgi:hypothetical protein
MTFSLDFPGMIIAEFWVDASGNLMRSLKLLFPLDMGIILE